jgi:hypothetical protein
MNAQPASGKPTARRAQHSTANAEFSEAVPALRSRCAPDALYQLSSGFGTREPNGLIRPLIPAIQLKQKSLTHAALLLVYDWSGK